MADNDIVSRVRKLFARSKSDNPHEAATAAALARKMMQDYGLSQADIDGQTPDSVGDFDAPGDFSAPWRFSLLTAIAMSHYSRVVRILESKLERQGRRAVPKETWKGKVIGKRADVEATLYLFAYFESEMNRLCEEQYYDMLAGIELDSFRRGVVYAIQRRVLEQMKRRAPVASAKEKAMVTGERSDKGARVYLDNTYRGRETNADLGRAKDANAFFHGYNAGMKLVMPEKERRLPDQAEAEAEEKSRAAKG